MKIPINQLNGMRSRWVCTPANGYLGSCSGGQAAVRALLGASLTSADVEQQVPAFQGRVVDVCAYATTSKQAVLKVALTGGEEASANFAT